MDISVFSQLEKLAFLLQKKYMAGRRTIEVVEKGRARFHPQDCCQKILLEYSERIKKLKNK